MLLLVGQVAREHAGREGFQELDYRADVRAAGQVGRRRSTTPRGVPEIVARAFAVATSGRPGAGRDRAARGHAHATRPTCPTRRRYRRAPPRAPGRARAGAPARAARAARERPLIIVGEGGWTRAGRRRRRRVRGGAARSLWPRRSAARTTSTTARRVYAGHAGLAMDPALARRSARPTCCSRSAAAWARSRRRLHAPARPRARASGSSTCTPTRTSSARSTSRSSASSRASSVRGRPARARRRPAPIAAPALLEAAHAEYERNLRERRELPGRAADWPTSWRCCASGCRPDAILTSGAGNFTRLGAPLLRVPPLRDASSRRAAARWATAFPAAVAAKAVHPDRPVVCLAGDGDFLMTGQELATAVQDELADRRARRQQRHVRDDPHAPGAPLPGPRRRHRPRQPRLRRLRAGVRRARRARRAHRGLRRRARRGAGVRAVRPCSSCASTPRRSPRARR